MMPLYVYGGNFSFPFMFNKMTKFQFPHEKMGFVMKKHNINHTIVDNERYLSNLEINMMEIHMCDSSFYDDNFDDYNFDDYNFDDYNSNIFGVRVNYCFKCSHTSDNLADISSCKYNTYSVSNDLITEFYTYTDSSCSTGDIYQYYYSMPLNTCSQGYKTIYTTNYEYDTSMPGINEVEYSDTSCSIPFTFHIMDIYKGACSEIYGGGSLQFMECSNNNIQYRMYMSDDCSGISSFSDTQQLGTCTVITYPMWYQDLSDTATIDYLTESFRSITYCSSLSSPISNLNPTLYPTANSIITLPKEICDNCPSYHMWIVTCGTLKTPNTDIMCNENGDEFTCCSSNGTDCCVANGGTITLLVFVIIAIIVMCGYKCCGCPTKKQIAIMTQSTPSVLDTKIRLTDSSSRSIGTDDHHYTDSSFSIKAIPLKNKYTPTTTQCGNELIKPMIKPLQKEVQEPLSNMEEGIPLTETKMIPVQQPKKSKKSKKSKRNR